MAYLDLTKKYGWRPEQWITEGSQYISDPGRYGDYGNITGQPNFLESTFSGIKSELESTYGYSSDVSRFITDALGGEHDRGDRLRATLRSIPGAPYGSTYDVDKYFGGVKALAQYLAAGKPVKQITAPPSEYAAGGYQVLVPGEKAPTTGLTRNDAIQQILQETGKEPTESQIVALTGQPAGTSLASVGVTEPGITPTGKQQSLVDIYTSRPDLQAEAARLFPGQNPTVGGTEANRWLNDWWNKYGVNEYPGTELVQPEQLEEFFQEEEPLVGDSGQVMAEEDR